MWLNWVITCTGLEYHLYNQPSTGPIHLELLSERCDISVLPRHCSVWGCVWTTWDEHNEAIQRLLEGIKLRAITQRRRPAPKDWRQRLNARRNQALWNWFKTDKMAAMKPSEPSKWRYARAKRVYIENRTKTWGKPDDVTTDATQSACSNGNFHWDALDCACPLEIPVSGYKSSQRSRSWLIPSEDLATYTSILSFFGSTCICFSTQFPTLIPLPHRTLSQQSRTKPYWETPVTDSLEYSNWSAPLWC